MIQAVTFSKSERNEFIELTLIWEGQINASTLIKHFQVSRPTANSYLTRYQGDTGVQLEYCQRTKSKKLISEISAKYSTGSLDEYIALQDDISSDIAAEQPYFTQLEMPFRNINPVLVRPIIHAIKAEKRLYVGYASMASGEFEERIIRPQRLVFDGIRWHVRAWCEKAKAYRDFVLSRFSGEYEFEQYIGPLPEPDQEWQTYVTLEIQPDPRLAPAQQKFIAGDYQMHNGSKKIQVRAALVKYLYLRLRLDQQDQHAESQQIIVTARSIQAISPYLPPSLQSQLLSSSPIKQTTREDKKDKELITS